MFLRAILLTFANVLVIIKCGPFSKGGTSKHIASIDGSKISCGETDKLEKMYANSIDEYLIRNRRRRVKKASLKLVSCCENVRWYNKYRKNSETYSRITEENTLSITIERNVSKRRAFLQIQSDVVILDSETCAFLDDFWIMIEKSETIVFAISPPQNCQDNILGALSEILENRMVCRPTVANISRCAELFLNYVAKMMVRKSFSMDKILRRYTSEVTEKINRVKFPKIPVPSVILNGAQIMEATAGKSVDSLQYVARIMDKPAEVFGTLLSPSARALGSKIIAKLFEGPNVAEKHTDEFFEAGARVANSVDSLITGLESSVHILGNSVVNNSVEIIKGTCGEKLANTTLHCLNATKMCAINGTAIILATPIKLAITFLTKLFDIRRSKIINESKLPALKGNINQAS